MAGICVYAKHGKRPRSRASVANCTAALPGYTVLFHDTRLPVQPLLAPVGPGRFDPWFFNRLTHSRAISTAITSETPERILLFPCVLASCGSVVDTRLLGLGWGARDGDDGNSLRKREQEDHLSATSRA
ncbi:hypothetical protein ColLi_12114 [Colletotrichum liriopes]|uniref:Uncharacterized protein n=1 Tax=Colletotrichum liriopes TaxID=708192 RepID=A0AA37LZ61_9PEZI|nr:hypothetical protein ColLi_12114 [Colletotrichum liriopes]